MLASESPSIARTSIFCRCEGVRVLLATCVYADSEVMLGYLLGGTRALNERAHSFSPFLSRRLEPNTKLRTRVLTSLEELTLARRARVAFFFVLTGIMPLLHSMTGLTERTTSEITSLSPISSAERGLSPHAPSSASWGPRACTLEHCSCSTPSPLPR